MITKEHPIAGSFVSREPRQTKQNATSVLEEKVTEYFS